MLSNRAYRTQNLCPFQSAVLFAALLCSKSTPFWAQNYSEGYKSENIHTHAQSHKHSWYYEKSEPFHKDCRLTAKFPYSPLEVLYEELSDS